MGEMLDPWTVPTKNIQYSMMNVTTISATKQEDVDVSLVDCSQTSPDCWEVSLGRLAIPTRIS